MTKATAVELQRLLERSGLRDPSLTDEDRIDMFSLALRRLPDFDLEWLSARLAEERRNRT